MLSCNVINTLLIKLLQTLFLHSQRDGHNLETDHGDAEAANWWKVHPHVLGKQFPIYINCKTWLMHSTWLIFQMKRKKMAGKDPV